MIITQSVRGCTVLIQQVPFSFSRYRSLAYILMSRYLLFKFALPFSLAPTYKRLAQPYRGFLRLCRYSKTFLRTFLYPVHTQSMPRSRDAAWIDENWTLTERRVRHLKRRVLGRYLLSCHTVIMKQYNVPDSKVHGANMEPICGQDPGGPHVGLMNFVIWGF